MCGNKTDERGDCKICGCPSASLELEHILLSMELEEHGISLEPDHRPATRTPPETRTSRTPEPKAVRPPPIVQQKPTPLLPTLDFFTRNQVPGRPPSFLRM
jgi:hypothetical protein